MATTYVSVEEYLRTSYRPDVEYIDGELRPKNSVLEEDPVVQWVHAHLQALISAWFVQHEDEWGILAGVEARTRVAADHYRLPDVVVIEAAPEEGTILEPPLVVVEILSPATHTRKHSGAHGSTSRWAFKTSGLLTRTLGPRGCVRRRTGRR